MYIYLRIFQKYREDRSELVADHCQDLGRQSDSEVDQATDEFIQYRKDKGYDKLAEERNNQIADNKKKME